MGDGEHVAVIPAQQLQLYKPVAVAAAEFWEIGGGGAVGVGGLFLLAQIILGAIVVHDLVKRLIGRQDVPNAGQSDPASPAYFEPPSALTFHRRGGAVKSSVQFQTLFPPPLWKGRRLFRLLCIRQ